MPYLFTGKGISSEIKYGNSAVDRPIMNNIVHFLSRPVRRDLTCDLSQAGGKEYKY
jgi:hypothetical protein